jgi:putative cardiolipin synthase
LASLEADQRSLQERREDFDRLTSSTADFAPLAEGERDALNYGPLSHDIAHPPLRLLRGQIRVVADDPEKVSGRAADGHDATTVTAQVVEAIGQAREEALIASPYFVPGTTALGDLRAARKRGVAITIVTNSMAANDEPFVSAAYERYRKRMLQAGIQIYEVSPRLLHAEGRIEEPLGRTTGRLHAKALVIDHRTTFVGSMNFDFRSSRLNTELGLFIDSPELAGEVTDLASRLRSIGTYRMRLSPMDEHVQWISSGPDGEKIFDSEPEVDGLTKLKLLLFSPFIDEGLL